jgi:hypothetical protein
MALNNNVVFDSAQGWIRGVDAGPRKKPPRRYEGLCI